MVDALIHVHHEDGAGEVDIDNVLAHMAPPQKSLKTTASRLKALLRLTAGRCHVTLAAAALGLSHIATTGLGGNIL